MSEEKRARFYSIVMLLMYIAIRGRKDIQPTISFLSQRVNVCTDEDYHKLRRLMRYIAGIMDMMSYIGATDLFVMVHFVDTAYAMHNDF